MLKNVLKNVCLLALGLCLGMFSVACGEGNDAPAQTTAQTDVVTEEMTDKTEETTIEMATSIDTTAETMTETSMPIEAGTDVETDIETDMETVMEPQAATQATTEAVTEEPVTEAPTHVTIDEDCRLVVSAKTYQTAYLLDSVKVLQASIQTATGHKLTISRINSATVSPNGSILVGQTPCDESKAVAEALPDNSYTITVKDGKVVVLGSDDNLTVYAMAKFRDEILTSDAYVQEGKLVLPVDYAQTVTVEKPLALKDMLANGFGVTTTSQYVLKANPTQGCGIAQGAASDGTYVYLAMRNSDDTGTVIAKHRLDDGSFVAVSGVLDLGHANDMTFNTKQNVLVVAHGQKQGKILTLINPETLEAIENVDIEKGAGAIAYRPENDTYAISQGGKSLHFLDGELAYVKSFERTKVEGYTAQGMGADENFIFFPMSSAANNILDTFDWDGNKVGEILIPMAQESESLIYVNGRYFVVFNVSGAVLYEIFFQCYLK